MEDKTWKGPSEEKWNRMQSSLDHINEHIFGVDKDGGVSPNSRKSVINVILRMTETLFGPDGERERGLDRRTEALEQARRDEAQQRKGALYVVGFISSLIGGAVTATITWLLHGKKP